MKLPISLDTCAPIPELTTISYEYHGYTSSGLCKPLYSWLYETFFIVNCTMYILLKVLGYFKTYEFLEVRSFFLQLSFVCRHLFFSPSLSNFFLNFTLISFPCSLSPQLSFISSFSLALFHQHSFTSFSFISSL